MTIPIRLPLPCPGCKETGKLRVYPFGGIPVVDCAGCDWYDRGSWERDAERNLDITLEEMIVHLHLHRRSPETGQSE